LAGQALVLFDPQRMLVEEVVLCEDGHEQERSLLDQVLPLLAKNDLLIADRNFCTLAFLFGIKACGAPVHYSRTPGNALEITEKTPLCWPLRDRVSVRRAIELHDPRTDGTSQVRRITIRLKTVTRDGDQEIHVLTNLPSKVSAVRVADLYRQSWTLEQAFNELTTHLRCELNTLVYPKAALFAFWVAAKQLQRTGRSQRGAAWRAW